jgi:hypothetical protein
MGTVNLSPLLAVAMLIGCNGPQPASLEAWELSHSPFHSTDLVSSK